VELAMTAAVLKNYTARDLAQMAKAQGVAGWHSMRKEELVRALLKCAKLGKGDAPTSACDSAEAITVRQPSPTRMQISQIQAKLEAGKNLGTSESASGRPVQDRLVVMVRDPYWLQAYWELSRQSVDRAQSAMGQHWHQSQPVLRLFKLAHDGTSALARQIPIHGGVSHWYVDVQDPPATFRMEIGYAATNGHFYCLARSNSVTTPPAGTSDSVDENWADVADNADRIFAMSGGYTQRGTSLELQELLEERLGRPLGTPMETRFGDGAARGYSSMRKLKFSVDAELLVFGVSNPDAHVTLQGEPVPLRPDGSFSIRMTLADRRQVIPVVASSSDGLEQRTIILAVERNTKVLEPRVRDLPH
jgi:hypothetical protein